MREHPTPQTLDRFLRGELPAVEGAAVLKHLVRGCGQCLAAVSRHLRGVKQRKDSGSGGEVYDAAFDRAFGLTRKAAEDSRKEARLVDKAYAALVARGVSGVGASSRRFGNLTWCLALLRRSWELRHEDPGQMLLLARIAEFGSRCVKAARFGAARVADLRARALAELANAQRITGDLAGAERGVREALERGLHGTQDPSLGAHLLTIQATICGDSRRFPEALDLLASVEKTYAALAALDLAAVWLEQKHSPMAATLVEQAGETFAAIGINRELLGALLLLQRACERGVAEATMVHRLATQLRHLEHDPGARFDQR